MEDRSSPSSAHWCSQNHSCAGSADGSEFAAGDQFVGGRRTQTPGALPIDPSQYAASRPTKNPYARLFSPREASREAGGIRRTDTKIVCGLALWDVDPLIDPAMARRLPDTTVQPKVRRIEPAMCRDEPRPAR